VTQAERSKSMNSRTFSCGERSPGPGEHVDDDGIEAPPVESLAAAPT
jgi:hypothetical protein